MSKTNQAPKRLELEGDNAAASKKVRWERPTLRKSSIRSITRKSGMPVDGLNGTS